MRPLAPRLALLVALVATVASTSARAAIITINFDTTPNLPVAPTIFSNPRQDLPVPGVGTVLGGTPVSTPTNLASFGPGGGVSNSYGTRSGTANGYAQDLTIDFDPLAIVTRVQGTLFNGYNDLNSYTVTAFNGVTQVATQSLDNLPDNSDPTGFANWDLSAAQITQLVITPDTTFSGGAWNYFIDNVTVTYTVTAIPEPGPTTLALLATSLAGLGLAGRRLCGTKGRRRGPAATGG